MAKKTWVKVSGSWREVKNAWTKANGVWKQKVVPKGRVGSAWKEFIQYMLYSIRELWTKSVPLDSPAIGTASMAVGSSDSLYIGISKNTVIRLDSAGSEISRRVVTNHYGNSFPKIEVHNSTSDRVVLFFPSTNSGLFTTFNKALSTQWTVIQLAPGEYRSGIAIDKNNNIYVVKTENLLQKFSGSLALIWEQSTPASSAVVNIATDSLNNVYYVSNVSSNRRIYKRDLNGVLIGSYNWSTIGIKEFTDINGIVIDNKDFMFVTAYDLSLYKINTLTMKVVWSVNLKSFDSSITTFNPYDKLEVDSDGNVYVVNSNKICKIDSNGNFIYNHSLSSDLRTMRVLGNNRMYGQIGNNIVKLEQY